MELNASLCEQQFPSIQKAIDAGNVAQANRTYTYAMNYANTITDALQWAADQSALARFKQAIDALSQDPATVAQRVTAQNANNQQYLATVPQDDAVRAEQARQGAIDEQNLEQSSLFLQGVNNQLQGAKDKIAAVGDTVTSGWFLYPAMATVLVVAGAAIVWKVA